MGMVIIMWSSSASLISITIIRPTAHWQRACIT